MALNKYEQIRAAAGLQMALGFQGDEIDGKIGSQTMQRAESLGPDAVKELQRIVGANQTGIIDKQTKDAASAQTSMVAQSKVKINDGRFFADQPFEESVRPLLDQIALAEASVEAGGSATDPSARSYSSMNRTGGNIYPNGLVNRTIEDVANIGMAEGASAGTPSFNPTGAAGRYQFLPQNLMDLATQAGFDPTTQLFDEAAQDKLAEFSIRQKRGVTDQMLQQDPNQAANLLAQEWAGLPVATTPSNKSWINAGQSYYTEQGGPSQNAANIDLQDFLDALRKSGAIASQRDLIGRKQMGLLRKLPENF
jgi:hypothetical protein